MDRQAHLDAFNGFDRQAYQAAFTQKIYLLLANAQMKEWS